MVAQRVRRAAPLMADCGLNVLLFLTEGGFP